MRELIGFNILSAGIMLLILAFSVELNIKDKAIMLIGEIVMMAMISCGAYLLV